MHDTQLRAAALVSVAAVAAGITWSLYNERAQPSEAVEHVAGGSPAFLAAVETVRAPSASNPSKGLVMLERAAHDGYAPAQYEFGLALRDGKGVGADPERALVLLRMAADAGVTRAQFELGRMYNDGIGVLRNIAKGFAWLNLAAENGLADAVIARDALLLTMSPDDVLVARREARRLLGTYQNTSDATRNPVTLASGRSLGEE